MQPFPTIQNYGFQPQYGNYPQYNPVMPYQDRLAQLQAQYNQQQTFNQISQANQAMGLNGEVVDSLDVVKAKNVDLSGAVTYYPKADLSEIYTKQLQADGTSKIITYKAVIPETNQQDLPQQSVTIEMLNSMLGQLKQDLSQEIGGIKEMVSALAAKPDQAEPLKTQQRGGGQK